MNSKYTKRQIVEAIKYWQKQLDNINESEANKNINEFDFGMSALGIAAAGPVGFLFGTLFDDYHSSYFKKHKIRAFDNDDNDIKTKDKREQAEQERLRKMYADIDARRKTEQINAAKENRVAIRLALPSDFGGFPRTFFTTYIKEGQLENIYDYKKQPWNMWTIYGPMSQLLKIFKKPGQVYFARDMHGNKIHPNSKDIADHLIDSDGYDMTFYPRPN